MSSNIFLHYNARFNIQFENDYNDDNINDRIALDKLIISISKNINFNKDEAEKSSIQSIIIENSHTLSFILQTDPSIHHITKIIKYNECFIEIVIHNTNWIYSNELNSILPPIYSDEGDIAIHYKF